jgi:hypothetical protein
MSKIESVEIKFKDGETIREIVNEEKEGQKTVKIQISTAIFIQKKLLKTEIAPEQNYINMEVIPFHKVESIEAVVVEEENNKEAIIDTLDFW